MVAGAGADADADTDADADADADTAIQHSELLPSSSKVFCCAVHTNHQT